MVRPVSVGASTDSASTNFSHDELETGGLLNKEPDLSQVWRQRWPRRCKVLSTPFRKTFLYWCQASLERRRSENYIHPYIFMDFEGFQRFSNKDEGLGHIIPEKGSNQSQTIIFLMTSFPFSSTDMGQSQEATPSSSSLSCDAGIQPVEWLPSSSSSKARS